MIETIFSGIGTIIFALIGYFYNSWRNVVRENRKVYIRYIWHLSMNETLLTHIKSGDLPIESGCSQLQLLEPYTLRYIHFFDDQLTTQLLSYNNCVLISLTRNCCTGEELRLMLCATQSCKQNIKQHLSLIDTVIAPLSPSSFLTYLGLPVFISWIAKKYLSQTSENIGQQTKPY